jgi:hypothetical protein
MSAPAACGALRVWISAEPECLVIAGVRCSVQGAPVGGLVAKLGTWVRRIVAGGDGTHVVADGR